jgi:hypothetical protein
MDAIYTERRSPPTVDEKKHSTVWMDLEAVRVLDRRLQAGRWAHERHECRVEV